MPIDFPSSPSDGQEFTTSTGVTYQYFATKGYWRSTRTSTLDGGSSAAVSTQVNYDGGVATTNEEYNTINNLDGGSA